MPTFLLTAFGPWLGASAPTRGLSSAWSAGHKWIAADARQGCRSGEEALPSAGGACPVNRERGLGGSVETQPPQPAGPRPPDAEYCGTLIGQLCKPQPSKAQELCR